MKLPVNSYHRMSDLSSIEEYLQGEIDPAYALRARYILDVVCRVKPETILDTGCGRGFYPKMLSLLDFPKAIYGVDLLEKHVRLAEQLVHDDQNRVTFKQASIYELPFPDSSLDFVICSEVLEHLDDPQKGVDEIYRVLRTGGNAVFTVPSVNFPFFWDPLNWLLMRVFNTHVNKDIHWLAGIWADHERLYDVEGLLEHFEKGFEVLSVRQVVGACWPLSHFMIYGIGKNLVERGLLTSFNRFNFERPGRLKQALARFMALPTAIFDRDGSNHGTIICLNVRKI